MLPLIIMSKEITMKGNLFTELHNAIMKLDRILNAFDILTPVNDAERKKIENLMRESLDKVQNLINKLFDF